jgi:hypothetical protein
MRSGSGNLDSSTTAWPSLSMLVAGWKCAQDVAPFLTAFADIEYSEKQLVLCVGGDDASYERARAFAGPGVVVLEQVRGEGKQSALQKCAREATGSVVFLTDIDSRPSTDSVMSLIRPIVERQAEVVTGGMRPLDEQIDDPFVRVQWCFTSAVEPAHLAPVMGILGCNVVLTRQALAATGDFVEPTVSGTDYLLARQVTQAGYAIRYARGTPMRTAFSSGFRDHADRQTRWLSNLFEVGIQFGAWSDVIAVIRALTLAYASCFGAISVTMVVITRGRARTVWLALGVIGLAPSVSGIWNRSRLVKAAGQKASLLVLVRHFAATQWAGLRCSFRLVTRRRRW